MIHMVVMPNKGDEFHHFGWNACSIGSVTVSHGARFPRGGATSSSPGSVPLEFISWIRNLILPTRRFTRLSNLRKSSKRPATRGPIQFTAGRKAFTSALSVAVARMVPEMEPPGVFIMDCETFDVLGRWEIDRGPQTLHYDFWWNLAARLHGVERMGVATAAVRE